MMTFKELREQSGMNMKQFAAHFEIPYRTIQNWEAGVNKCPEYLLKLMKFRLDHEQVTYKIKKSLSELGIPKEEAEKIFFGK